MSVAGRVEDGRGSLGPCGNAPFPTPAHQTGRADFRHPAFRLISPEAHALRPAGLLSRPRRPLSRGSSPAVYPTEPLVSYRINRHLSGWNLPPLMIRPF